MFFLSSFIKKIFSLLFVLSKFCIFVKQLTSRHLIHLKSRNHEKELQIPSPGHVANLPGYRNPSHHRNHLIYGKAKIHYC